jgi:hypothetical protein
LIATETVGQPGLVTFTFLASGPTTTAPGSVITITGGPNATANIVGPHNDPADFYGIILGLVAIAIAIALTRWLFGRKGANSWGPRSR